jgi:serine protease Do
MTNDHPFTNPTRKRGLLPSTVGWTFLSVLFLSIAILTIATPAPAQEVTGLQAALALEKTLVDVIAKTEKSVVAIARVRKDNPRTEEERMSPDFVPNEFGTGVVVDRQGKILTNYHVLGDIDKHDYYVWTNRRPFRARATVEACDPWTDLAVLQISADNLEPITLGDAKDLKKGQIVIALGNPYAVARDGEVSAGWGIISNLSRQTPSRPAADRPLDGREMTLHHYGTLIQTDAKLNLGTSGGALVNLKGEMIGLTTALAALDTYQQSGGYAIPVDADFKRTLEMLKTGRKAQFGFLGIAPEPLSVQQRQQGQFGARIREVIPGTPAAIAGLQFGDVITHVNSQPVYDPNTLIRDLSKMPLEARVELTVERGAAGARTGRAFKVTAVLSKKYVTEIRPAYSKVEEPIWRGLRVDYATAMPREVFRDHAAQIDPAGCVVAVDVLRDSPAWKAGVRPWTFISHVGTTRISKPQQFYDAVATQAGIVRVRTTDRQTDNPVLSIAP